MCMSFEGFALFLRLAELTPMLETINELTVVIHAEVGDLIWIVYDGFLCSGGIPI